MLAHCCENCHRKGTRGSARRGWPRSVEFVVTSHVGFLNSKGRSSTP